MSYAPADVALGPIFFIFGVGAALVVLTLAILSEAVVLWLLSWGSFSRSLLDAFLMNVASTVPGIGLAIAGLITGIASVGFLVVTWAVSVGVEGGVLLLLKRHPAPVTWRAALLANLVSYSALGLLILFL
jgi:hypothetical protein